MRLALITVVTLVGCRVDVSFPTGLACADGLCPDGQTCVSDFCVDSVPVEDDAGLDEADGAVPSTRECGGSAAMVEAFDDGLADWWVEFNNVTSLVSLDGAVLLSLEAGAEEDSSVAFSGPRLDLLDSHFHARITPANGGTTTFALISGFDARTIFLRHSDGILSVGSDGDSADLAFDPAAHAYWGFRERNGRVFFETSADGVSFDVRHSVATPDYAVRFQLMMRMGRDGAGDLDGARFDDINVGADVGSDAHTFCAAETRADDFEDGTVDDIWSVFGSACSGAAEETGGELVVTPQGPGFCVIRTANLHDLRDSHFTLELGSVASTYFKFSIDGAYGELIAERVVDQINVTECRLNDPETCVQLGGVVDGGQTFWRFRGVGDTAIFELSVDGLTFVEVAESQAFDISEVGSKFHGGEGESYSAAGFN